MKGSESRSVVSDSLQLHRLYSPWHSPGQNTGVGGLSLLPKPGIKTRSPALWADSLPAEPPGKPKNTGVVSLSLLQQIFQSQELNQGLLHCRWIPYQSDKLRNKSMKCDQYQIMELCSWILYLGSHPSGHSGLCPLSSSFLLRNMLQTPLIYKKLIHLLTQNTPPK